MRVSGCSVNAGCSIGGLEQPATAAVERSDLARNSIALARPVVSKKIRVRSIFPDVGPMGKRCRRFALPPHCSKKARRPETPGQGKGANQKPRWQPVEKRLVRRVGARGLQD